MRIFRFLLLTIVFSIHPLNLFATNEGLYSKKIKELTNIWSKKETQLKVPDKINELEITAIPTKNDNTYIGIMAKATIQAKLENVLTVLKNIDGYKNIYEGLDEVSFVKSKDLPDDFEIHWKFSGPLGTHTIYDSTQKISQLNSTKGLLVYQLKKSEEVLDADGFIFLEQNGNSVKFVSVDFFNAKWGIIGTFFRSKIWETTFDNVKKATLEIKKQSEKLANLKDANSEKPVVSYIGNVSPEKQKSFENLDSYYLDGI